jgi:hypothetical protein
LDKASTADLLKRLMPLMPRTAVLSIAEMNERLMAFGDSLPAAPGRRPCIIFAGRPVKNASPRGFPALEG